MHLCVSGRPIRPALPQQAAPAPGHVLLAGQARDTMSPQPMAADLETLPDSLRLALQAAREGLAGGCSLRRGRQRWAAGSSMVAQKHRLACL